MSGTVRSANVLDEALIERIVAEVLRRLPGSVPRVRKQHASSPDFHIEGRVVSLESLRACGDVVKRVIVGDKAIVTPAVIDELRDRGLTLVRCGSAGPAIQSRGDAELTVGGEERAANGLTIGRVDSASGPGWEAVSRLGHATINGGLVSVLPRLTKQLSGGGHGVLVTSAPAAAVYHACQHGLRAVYATNGRDVGEAKNQFDANLLVVDSHGSSNGGLESFLSRG